MVGRLLNPPLRRIDHWLFEEYKSLPEDLGAFRILFAIYALVVYWQRATWTIDMPEDFWGPPRGFTYFMDRPPSPVVVYLLNAALTTALVALLAGYRTVIASLTSFVLLIALNSIYYSYHKIDHDILLVIAPFWMALSGWGLNYSIDSRQGRQPAVRGWCLSFFALCVAIGMFSAGWPKLMGGWLDWDSQAVYGIVQNYFYVQDTRAIALEPILDCQSKWFWEPHDWLTVGVELFFIVAVINRQLFRWTCAAMTLLHVGILLVLDIPFGSNIIAYAAFVPLAASLRKLWPLLPGVAVLTALVVPWQGVQHFTSSFMVLAGGVYVLVWPVYSRLFK
jgi:hypothetical protein